MRKKMVKGAIGSITRRHKSARAPIRPRRGSISPNVTGSSDTDVATFRPNEGSEGVLQRCVQKNERNDVKEMTGLVERIAKRRQARWLAQAPLRSLLLSFKTSLMAPPIRTKEKRRYSQPCTRQMSRIMGSSQQAFDTC